MKLLAENEYENNVLDGLSLLLSELNIDVKCFRREESIAALFWSADDFIAFTGPLAYSEKAEREAFLLSIEGALNIAMISAGYETIFNELERLSGCPLSQISQ